MAHRKAIPANRRDRSGVTGIQMSAGTCATCGKFRYEFKRDAKMAVARLSGGTSHFYRCNGWWHYTSMTAEQVAAIREADREGGQDARAAEDG